MGLRAGGVKAREGVTLRGRREVQNFLKRNTEFLARYGAEFPSACACLQDDLEALLNVLRLPWRLRKFLHTRNLCERSFVKERRRSKTLPRFFTEQSCLKLALVTLIRAAERWQRIAITRLEQEQLKTLYHACGLTPAQPIGHVA